LREVSSAAQTNEAKEAFPARKQTVPARKQTVPARKESVKRRLFARQAQTKVPAILAVASRDWIVTHPIQGFGARFCFVAENNYSARAAIRKCQAGRDAIDIWDAIQAGCELTRSSCRCVSSQRAVWRL
jgi:hypothetical protein